MKTIGLLGGMSWESTVTYYKIINEEIKKSLGGLHSAKVILNSLDFDPIEKMQMNGDWELSAQVLSDAALGLQKAGADFLLICSNTMHKIADHIERNINIPLLHIADTTAELLVKNNICTVGLIGTKFTMEEGFYKDRLSNLYHLKVITPNKPDREIINRVIYTELCLGKILNNSRKEFLRTIEQLANKGAEAVILGCTEINLLINQHLTQVRLFDTTAIHALKAAEMAIL